MFTIHSALTFALCLVGFAAPGLAANSVPANSTAADALSKLHHSNQMEIQMGKVAIRKGASEGVRDYGQMLVKDHSAADEKVLALAKQEGFALREPQPKDAQEVAEHKAAMEGEQKLNDPSLTGASFDTFFLNLMKVDHRNDLRDVQQAAQQLKGTPTGKLMSKVEPILKKHLQHAETLSTPIAR